MTQFQVGGTYEARSAADYDTIFWFTVVHRTAKFVTVKDSWGKTKRVGVSVWGDSETCLPLGRYSMAPVLRAG